MTYDFSFDKKTISLLLGGLAFVGVMLFIAGLLVGASWTPETPAAAPATLAVGQPAAVATSPAPAQTAAPLPNDPVLKGGTATPDTSAPGGAADAPGAAPTVAKQAHNALGAAGSASAAGASGAGAPPPGNADDVRLIQEAQPSGAAVGDGSEQQAYSVQVDVFADKNEATQLLRHLQNKGYAPVIFEASDEDRKMKYAVRVGVYSNKAAADQLAATIARQENRKTVVVRPLGSL